MHFSQLLGSKDGLLNGHGSYYLASQLRFFIEKFVEKSEKQLCME
jgi:hypothetical protein